MAILKWSLLAGRFLLISELLAYDLCGLNRLVMHGFAMQRSKLKNSLTQEVKWSAPSLMPGKR